MTKKNQEVLDVAGLSLKEAATLFGKGENTIRQKISSRLPFSPERIALILNDLKRRDSDRLGAFISFIEDRYSAGDHLDRILPHRCGLQQVIAASAKADKRVVTLNENLNHLAPKAVFSELLAALLTLHPERLGLIVPNAEVMDYLRYRFGALLTANVLARKVGTVPTILCASKASSRTRVRAYSYRAFVVSRFSIDEVEAGDAELLWWQAHRAVGGVGLFQNRVLLG